MAALSMLDLLENMQNQTMRIKSAFLPESLAEKLRH